MKNAGGNKSKRQGRKHINTPQQRNVRYIKEEGEVYAVVTKLLGGSNCEVMCMDGNVRLCIIRNKFRGRDKRDNTIGPNVWVLVGIRDWEARAGKPQKCDLLEVYSDADREKIKTNGGADVTSLIRAFEDPSSDAVKMTLSTIKTSIFKNIMRRLRRRSMIIIIMMTITTKIVARKKILLMWMRFEVV